jgi:FkbM family methyltransferase
LNYNINKNVSISDRFTAYILNGYRYVCRLFTAHVCDVLTYRRIYKNYLSVLLHILKTEYPIEAISRTGNHIHVQNNHELFFVTQLERIGCKDYEIFDNKVSISFVVSETNNKKKVDFYDGVSNGNLIGIFFNKEYDFLPVDGKAVLDIGANIGDSCVYFALRGSSRIIAIEPFPRNYELAKKNIDVNGFTERITLYLAGCAAETGDIIVDPLYKSNSRSHLVGFKQGIKIPLLTLRDILIENDVSRGEAVLKVDCEGCEYETILSSTADTLRYFSHIELEYHRGYKNLKEKLEKCGFQVSVTRPIMQHSSSIQGKSTTYTGYLYAIKKRTKRLLE